MNYEVYCPDCEFEGVYYYRIKKCPKCQSKDIALIEVDAKKADKK